MAEAYWLKKEKVNDDRNRMWMNEKRKRIKIGMESELRIKVNEDRMK